MLSFFFLRYSAKESGLTCLTGASQHPCVAGEYNLIVPVGQIGILFLRAMETNASDRHRPGAGGSIVKSQTAPKCASAAGTVH